MNIATTIVPSLAPEPFDIAREVVNAWRGRCLDAFVRAEQAVTETLLALSETERGQSLRLLHLVGQRFDELGAALSEDGPFREFRAASKALTAFRQYDDLRVLLCHGAGQILLDKHGRWTAIMSVVAFQQRRVVRSQRVLGEQEAVKLIEEVTKASRKLCSQLGQVRAKPG